jgi:hypothetical protein
MVGTDWSLTIRLSLSCHLTIAAPQIASETLHRGGLDTASNRVYWWAYIQPYNIHTERLFLCYIRYRQSANTRNTSQRRPLHF